MSTGEVTAFLETIGLEHYASALINTGFYTSVDALSSATYEELMDCNVKPVHAKLILASLKSKAPSTPALASAEQERARMTAFLSGVGLEICQEALAQAGLNTIDSLKGKSAEDLIEVGLRAVHARLIVSNLDTVSRVAETPGPSRALSAALDDEAFGSPMGSLLGRKKKRSDPQNWRFLLLIGLLLTALALGAAFAFGGGSASVPPVGKGKGKGHAHGAVGGELRAAAKGKGKGKRAVLGKRRNATAIDGP
eukprot:CAMPEP_0181245774 /NCGR_PEP_ID=MMETSP1096-20121128/43626_1 /TAXON_ID=156174 ORGANISM="Chrysochromulina ericina, Strain CCMP281" /NCGR_SAMPLE_ID=MMETSP1096 /ASSEMBLY_ACC=CAM_ASM_000453 /LENGTH=251 /DNA_ID=CAMNT_0023342519 /DNA_START=109 /DNA_END=864 /DNA_ORIENTATION=-